MLRISNLTEIGSSFPRVYSPVEKTAVEADKLQVGALVQEETCAQEWGREEDPGELGRHCSLLKKLLCSQ